LVSRRSDLVRFGSDHFDQQPDRFALVVQRRDLELNVSQPGGAIESRRTDRRIALRRKRL
jgi:hypothetical protein